LRKNHKKEGPISSGSVFLNPSKKSDATVIQKRLSDLGYYKAKADGLFGKGSQRAVQNFKKDNQLGDNATWDIQTQKVLFRGTGL
jgi:peptidoglycan hydrolase-like protein with peptidoglycan-binding domain